MHKEVESPVGNKNYMSIAVAVVCEQRFSAQTSVDADRTTPASPQLHIVSTVSVHWKKETDKYKLTFKFENYEKKESFDLPINSNGICINTCK